jgi:hypothetical protein
VASAARRFFLGHTRGHNPANIRKRWVKRVTVALGYRCSDGLVLCADSEWTHGQSYKTHGTKVAHVQDQAQGFYFAMAGTGSYLFMQKVFDEYADDVQGRPPQTVADARARFDRKLKQIYVSEIFSIPHWESLDMDAQFLLGIRAGGSLAFLSTDTHIVGDAPDSECIGSGGEAASLVTKMMFRPMTRYEAALVAVYVLWLVKSTSVGVGGASSIVMLDANENGLWEKTLRRYYDHRAAVGAV